MASSWPKPSTAVFGLEARREFRCFNTDVAIQVSDWRWAHLIPAGESFFHNFESQFSRFRPESELSQFNCREVPSVSVSDELLNVLSECVRFHRLTNGVFNPLVLDNLEAAGYTASFERLGTVVETRPADVPPLLDCLELDQESNTVSLPLGLRLDLGGIGKGYAVDAASSLLQEAGDYLVEAGGDIYAAGRTPDGGAWRVDVVHPTSPDERIDVVALSDQAIATSWITRRRWRTRSGWAHHLIDPRTSLPTDSEVIGSTVITQSAVDADVFAKCALILGPEEGLGFLVSQGAQGLLVQSDGLIRRTNGWPSA